MHYNHRKLKVGFRSFGYPFLDLGQVEDVLNIIVDVAVSIQEMWEHALARRKVITYEKIGPCERVTNDILTIWDLQEFS